ncbi:putative aminopeptidase [Helianthus annuus]|nr:putative aminopeptidase [Helianthus annuus]KAJ0504069.1 putative aminopeptidase [Helianthus annuus]
MRIVDVAALSGACPIALGPSIAGVFTTSDELYKEVDATAKVTGERLYKLPMEEGYCEFMKFEVADTVITGVPHDGPITAALFLKQFVKEEIQWLHIDMSGPVWDDKKKTATGFAIPTLVEWIMSSSVSHSGAQVAATNLGAEMSKGQEPKRRKRRRRPWSEDVQKEN